MTTRSGEFLAGSRLRVWALIRSRSEFQSQPGRAPVCAAEARTRSRSCARTRVRSAWRDEYLPSRRGGFLPTSARAKPVEQKMALTAATAATVVNPTRALVAPREVDVATSRRTVTIARQANDRTRRPTAAPRTPANAGRAGVARAGTGLTVDVVGRQLRSSAPIAELPACR